jgi:hypothetical protein
MVGKAKRPSNLLWLVAMTLPPNVPKSRSPTNHRSTPLTRRTVGTLLSKTCRGTRGEKVRSLRDMGIAIDDLDALQTWMQSLRCGRVVDGPDDAARRIAVGGPVFARCAC